MSESLPEKFSRRAGEPELLQRLTERLKPTELNTLLLEVFQRQTQRSTPAALLAAYRRNRFVRPSALPSVAFRQFELHWLETAQQMGFEPLELSPVSPLGACSVVGTVHQNKVLSATRGTEVMADATNALALESIMQRQTAGFPAGPVSFCAAHRHVRTQVLNFPGFTPHFGILCLTTAGRDTGNFQFEQASLIRHIELYRKVLAEHLDPGEIKIVLRALDPENGENPLFERTQAHVRACFSGIELEIIRMPQSKQRYYEALQFGIHWIRRGQPYPIIDGGFTSWTRQLSGNRKERFLGSGIGLELLFKLLHDLI